MSKACPGSSTLPRLCNSYEQLRQKLEETNVHSSAEERKQEIMNLLHEFNDVKDAAQVVIGALANIDGKTFKEMHLHYNLPLKE